MSVMEACSKFVEASINLRKAESVGWLYPAEAERFRTTAERQIEDGRMILEAVPGKIADNILTLEEWESGLREKCRSTALAVNKLLEGEYSLEEMIDNLSEIIRG